MRRFPEALGRGCKELSWHCEAGLEAVEYALIAAVLLAALFITVPQFVNQFAPAYNAIMNALTQAMGN